MTTEVLWCLTHDKQIVVSWIDGRGICSDDESTCRAVPMMLVRKDAPSTRIAEQEYYLEHSFTEFAPAGRYVLVEEA